MDLRAAIWKLCCVILACGSGWSSPLPGFRSTCMLIQGLLPEASQLTKDYIALQGLLNLEGVSLGVDGISPPHANLTSASESERRALFTNAMRAFRRYFAKLARDEMLASLSGDLIYNRNQMQVILQALESVADPHEAPPSAPLLSPQTPSIFEKKLLGYKVLVLYTQWLQSLSEIFCADVKIVTLLI